MALSEDAAMEIEALEAIFAADFSRDAHDAFSILALPHGESQDSSNVAARVRFSLPPTYPHTSSPGIAVESVKGLSSETCNELKEFLESQSQPLMGEASVFSLIEACREWLVPRNTKGADDSMFGRMLEREGKRTHEEAKAKAAAAQTSASQQPATERVLSPEERAKLFQGTKVTAESYKRWLDAYLKESMAVKQTEDSRPTGRELFERGGQKVEEEDDDEVEDPDFDPAVFARDDDDVDVDSLSDE